MSTDLSQQFTLAHVRHELRTPINAILGYGELLLDVCQHRGDNTVINTLNKIHTCGQQLLSLIDSALTEERLQGNPGDWNGEIFSEADQVELNIFLDAIFGYCDWLELNVQTGLQPDIAKIRYGANQLLDLANQITKEALVPTIPAQVSAIPHRKSSTATAPNPLLQPGAVGFPLVSSPERPGHLLVVDDNEINRDLLSRQLSRQGHRVEVAINGEQALAKLGNCSYDLVLLDIVMPGLSGHDVLEQLMQHKQWRRIPVIMISALDELDNVVRCIEKGAADYLTKPFNPVILNARISSCLEKKHLHDLEVLHLDQLADANTQMSRYLQEVDRITAAAAAVEANTFDPANLVSVAARTDELGRLARVFTHTIQAINARECDLRLAEERYRSIFENALKGIFQSSPAGHYISVNPAMAKIYRYESPDDMVESVEDIAQQIYVDDERRVDFMNAIEQKGTVKQFKYRSYCKDGTIIWTQIDARVVRDKNDHALYYEGIVQDITELVRQEEQLRRQLEELRIEIDHEQRQEEVVSVTNSNYFQKIQQEVAGINLDDFWS